MKSQKIKQVTCILAIIAMVSCGGTKKASVWQPPADQYAFVEYYTIYQGQALEGDPPPGMRIDGPTYTFDANSGVLTSYQEVNYSIDTISFVLGAGIVRRGTEGGGISSRIVGASQLPLKQRSVNFESLSKEAVIFSFDNKQIVLKVGEAWEQTFESTDTIPSNRGNAVVLRKITHQVNFHGFYNKQDISFP